MFRSSRLFVRSWSLWLILTSVSGYSIVSAQSISTQAPLQQQGTAYPPSQTVRIDRDEAVLGLPEKITFVLAAEHPALEFRKVVLHYGFEELSCQESEATREVEFEPSSQIDVEWILDFKDDGRILPGTDLWWRWEIGLSDGSRFDSEVQWLTVQDQRHKWQTLKKDNLELAWYRGNHAFGADLLNILIRANSRLSHELGIEITDPIRVTVYPSYEELRQTLVYTYEWTGAVAVPPSGLILMVSLPGRESQARDTLTHEVAHLIVGRLTFNCAGVSVPTWLNEGLAMQMEAPIPFAARNKVTASLDGDRLNSLRSLAGGFSAYSDEAILNYYQSQMAVDFLVDEFGAEKLSRLLSAVAEGVPVDLAMISIYGFDTDGLDARWRKSLGYEMAPVIKITPAVEVIPTYALWTPIIQPTTTASPIPTNTVSPTSTATPTPQPSITPPAYPAPATPSLAAGENIRPNPSWVPILLIGSVGLAIGSGSIYFLAIKKRRLR